MKYIACLHGYGAEKMRLKKVGRSFTSRNAAKRYLWRHHGGRCMQCEWTILTEEEYTSNSHRIVEENING